MAFGVNLGTLFVRLALDSTQFRSEMVSVSRTMETSVRKMGALGRNLTMKLTAPLALIGGLGVRSFAKFDDAMTKSTAIMFDMTTSMRKDMEKVALQLSTKSAKSAEDLAKSYFFLASAGLSAKQSLAALPTVEAFAVAGVFDMARATELLTDAQSALGLTVADSTQNMINMGRVADTLIAANTLANATTEQFSLSLTSHAAPAMRALGVELEEGVSVLAAYADQGIKAQRSGTMFGRMLRLMIKGLNDNGKAWHDFGVKLEETNNKVGGADKKLRPLADIIEDITVRTKNLSPIQKAATLEMLGFQARSQQAILPLLGLSKRIRQYEVSLRQLKGVHKELRALQMESYLEQLRMVWHQIQNVGISIGRTLAPRVMIVAKAIADLGKAFTELSKPTRNIIIDLAIYGALLGPALLLTSKLALGLLALARAAQSGVVAFGLLNSAVAGFFVGFTGYKIGGRLFDEFKSIQIIGVQTVGVLKKSWEELKAAWYGLDTTMGIVWALVVRRVKVGFGEMFMEVAAGLRKLEKLTKRLGSEQDFFSGSLFTTGLQMVGQAEEDFKNFNLEVEDSYLELQQKLDAIDAQIAATIVDINKSFANKTADDNGAALDAKYAALLREQEVLRKNLEIIDDETVGLNKHRESINEAFRALEEEKNLVGKINDERKRSIALMEFKNVVLDLTLEKTDEYYRLIQQYEESLAELGVMQRQAEKTEALQRWAEDAEHIFANLGKVATNALDGVADTLTTLLTIGKANFKAFAASVISDIIKVIIKYQMLAMWQAIVGGISGGGLGSTLAGAVGAGSGSTPGLQGPSIPMAMGGILNSATLIPQANGRAVVGGEKGIEAVMPLKRNSEGKLGVLSENPPITVRPKFKFVTVFSEDAVADAMKTENGEQAILNVMQRSGVV